MVSKMRCGSGIVRIRLMGDLPDSDPGVKNRQKCAQKVPKTESKKRCLNLRFILSIQIL